ncbi:hypothetical protein L1987_57332 [Smallanthus sonchifolius]|uniref:Uncharacterized protein n=1 Tax=Smallanthus sonchifolius TaxID=185202 RepID=A0ACB9DCH7_9ASTR|nr:hypothetical protein L1987_57332 [Smallanthus sonchifolius]
MIQESIDRIIMSPIRRRMKPELTAEDIYYMRKIEELANERLRFFREKELHEQHAKERNKSKAKSKRPRSTSAPEDGQPRRKVPKKAVRTPVVSNEATERLKEFVVNELKGTDMKLVIQKNLYHSDTIQSQNRLSMPMNQLETDDFLTVDEKKILDIKNPKENEIEVSLVGPTLEMYCLPMKLKMWHMASTMNYVLKTHWFEFWEDNAEYLQEDVKIQVWSFRIDEKLCFAIACVDEPDGQDDVA